MSGASAPGPVPREPLSVFERYLGPGILPGEPLSLLGLGSPQPTDAQVLVALQKRLGQLSDHAVPTGPAANEVRFALHAAAAKLLEGSAAPPVPVSAQAQAAIDQVIAQNGGWNAAAMQQAMLAAHADPVDIAALARRATGVPPALPTVGAARSTSLGPMSSVMEPPAPEFGTPVESDPVKRFMLVGAWVVGGLCALLVAITAVIVVISRIPAPPAAPTPPVAAAPTNNADAGGTKPADALPNGTTPTPSDASTPKTAAAPAKTDLKHVEEWGDLVRELDAISPALRAAAPDAQDRFQAVMGRMAARWTGASPDERLAAVNGVVEAIYSIKDDADPSRELVRLIARPAVAIARSPLVGPEEIWPGVWAAGLLARISSERDLPRTIVRAIDDLSAEAFAAAGGSPAEASFEAGAASMLTALTGKLVPPSAVENEAAAKLVADSWKRWLAAAAALRGPDSDLYLSLALVALDRLTTASPEPTVNSSVLDAITTVTTGISWRERDISRRWLLRAFDNKAVSSADLFAVTSAIATRSGAPGVDQTMVLHAASPDAARAQLRDQYASVWGMASAEVRDAALAKWADLARAELARTDVSASPIPHLVQAVSLARLNAAASLIWSGRPDSAVTILTDVDSGMNRRLANLADTPRLQPIGRGLSAWALQYAPMMQTGGRFADRRRLLQDFQGAPNGADAQIIVDEACASGNDGIRGDAQALVKKFSDDASVVAAMLAKAPTMPQTISNTALVSMVALTPLPPPRDAGWRVAVRRALVERLLELVVGRSQLGIVDEISVLLAEAYALQVPPPLNAPAQPTDAGPIAMRASPPAEVAASALRARWLQEAEAAVPTGREPVSLARAASSRAARARIAEGRLQEFAAAQADICDLMAFVITAERTSRDVHASEILADLSRERRDASHVFVQFAASERAALRLWLLRLGEPGQGGAS